MSVLKPKTPNPSPVVKPPEKSDAEVQAAELEARKRAAAAKGNASTILTGGLGVSGAANTAKPAVLGY
jgi:hypothetical protein